MNKLTSTKNRFLISLVGPSETEKAQLLYNWLRIGTNQQKFDEIHSLYQHTQPLYDVLQKEIENILFVRGVNFEKIESLKTTLQSTWWTLKNQVKKVATQNHLLMLILLEDILDWKLFTLSKTCFVKTILGKTLSTRNSKQFSFNTPRCDASQYVFCWDQRIGTVIRAIGTGIRAIQPVPRCVKCSLQSFIDWLMAANIQSLTLLYK